MAFWIFTINDTDKMFEKRMNEKKWPIFAHTLNRKRIMKNDLVVFYKAGTDGHKFLGSAELDSETEKTEKIDSTVKLKNIKIFKTGVDIKDILHELIFIRSPSIWGNYLQGGIRTITERDFDTITSKSK